MQFLRFVIVGALLQYGTLARADRATNLNTLKVQRQGMAEFEKVIRKAKSAADLLEILNDHATAEDREFLASKLKGQKAPLGLKVLRKIENGVVLGQGAAAIPIAFIANETGIFLINNKRVDLSATRSPQEKWQAIESTLPKITRLHRKFGLLEEEAQANGYLAAAKAAGHLAFAAGSYAVGAISTGASICDTITKAWDFCSSAETRFSDYLKQKYGVSQNGKTAKNAKPHCLNPDQIPINNFDEEFKETGAAAAYADKMYTDSMDLWKKAVSYLWCAGNPASGLSECIGLIKAKKDCFSINDTRWRALGFEAQTKFPDAPVLLLNTPNANRASDGTSPRAVPKDLPQ